MVIVVMNFLLVLSDYFHLVVQQTFTIITSYLIIKVLTMMEIILHFSHSGIQFLKLINPDRKWPWEEKDPEIWNKISSKI